MIVALTIALGDVVVSVLAIIVLIAMWMIARGRVVGGSSIVGAIVGAVIGYPLGEKIAPCDDTVTECIGPSGGAALGGSVGLLVGAILGGIAGWVLRRWRDRGTAPRSTA